MIMQTKSGSVIPLGATISYQEGKQGVNFALYSSEAQAVELCLFQGNEEIRIPLQNNEHHIWHIWLENIAVGTPYAFRVYGKNEQSLANPAKLMLDPYAKAVIGKPDLSTAESRSWYLLNDKRDNAPVALKALVVDDQFNWEDDQNPNTSWAETIIYEMHVKGFSQLNTRLPEKLRGTYAGLAHPESIAYLQELGISAVELLPINYAINEPHLQQKGLSNYWGYNPVAMFAVESNYAATDNPLKEFKQMVKALHKAGIEVILDVVFNHTAESEKQFPTFCQRGIDDKTYYWQTENGEYINWTGCGNMLNLSNSVSRRWLIDCLRYWVEQCHVDGFRFDLASVLGRETPGFNPQAQLFAEIAKIPSLMQAKFIAEPWDIGEYGYQVGNFPVYFAEWNDRFRDDMCRFWLWKSGENGAFAQRFAGSSDLYQHNRLPHHSINFITAHDGFTLRDLVSYNQKHNWQNAEQNNDGRNENYSYNHGFEGNEGATAEIEQARQLSAMSILTSLLLANGTPMLLAGDEFGNSQVGNNNAYCQDNNITWLKWDKFNHSLFKQVKTLIQLRKKITSLQMDQWWTAENVQWLNSLGNPMSEQDWHNRNSKALQILLDQHWLLLINSKASIQAFHLPQGNWEVINNITEYTREENQLLLQDLGVCVLIKSKVNKETK